MAPTKRAAPARPSLVDFAAAESKANAPCWLCHIPERAEIEEAVLSGRVTKAAARRWLRDQCGYGEEATPNKLANHFNLHVRRTT